MDGELRDSVAGLSDTVSQLREAVANQTANTTDLTTQVKESNERSARDRKVLRILTGVVIAKLLTLILLGIALLGVRDTQAAIEDCTTPNGKCAQRGAAAAGQFGLSLAYRGEQQRLITELPISEQKGDAVRVEVTKKRLAELDQLIKQSDQTLADIRADKAGPTKKGN